MAFSEKGGVFETIGSVLVIAVVAVGWFECRAWNKRNEIRLESLRAEIESRWSRPYYQLCRLGLITGARLDPPVLTVTEQLWKDASELERRMTKEAGYMKLVAIGNALGTNRDSVLVVRADKSGRELATQQAPPPEGFTVWSEWESRGAEHRLRPKFSSAIQFAAALAPKLSEQQRTTAELTLLLGAALEEFAEQEVQRCTCASETR